jgi:hypothetical protein
MARVIIVQKYRSASLVALWTAAKHAPCSEKHACICKETMTLEEAEDLLKKTMWVREYRGRMINVDFTEEQVQVEAYNRANGNSAAQNALRRLRQIIHQEIEKEKTNVSA